MSRVFSVCDCHGDWKIAEGKDQIYVVCAEYSKSSRAGCRKCSTKIKKDEIRVGIPIKWRGGEHGYINSWQHLECTRVTEPEDFDPEKHIFGLSKLKAKDQKKTKEEVVRKDLPEHLKPLDVEDEAFLKREGTPITPLAQPTTVTRKLLPYQEEGYGWMVRQEQAAFEWASIKAEQSGAQQSHQPPKATVKQAATVSTNTYETSKQTAKETRNKNKDSSSTNKMVPAEAFKTRTRRLKKSLSPFDSGEYKDDVCSDDDVFEAIKLSLSPLTAPGVRKSRKGKLTPEEREKRAKEKAAAKAQREKEREEKKKAKEAKAAARNQEKELTPVAGGILADEMGMGKTLQCITLMVGQKNKEGCSGPTLVVCPTSSVLQWQDEITSHVKPGTLKVFVYYSNRERVFPKDLEKYDVVLTTYPVVEYEYRKIIDKKKVKCQYCSRKFLPRTLINHNKFFCGPDAIRSAKLQKTERTRKTATDKAMKTLRIGTKGQGGAGEEGEGQESSEEDGLEAPSSKRRKTRAKKEGSKPSKSFVPTPSNIYRELLQQAGRKALPMYAKAPTATAASPTSPASPDAPPSPTSLDASSSRPRRGRSRPKAPPSAPPPPPPPPPPARSSQRLGAQRAVEAVVGTQKGTNKGKGNGKGKGKRKGKGNGKGKGKGKSKRLAPTSPFAAGEYDQDLVEGSDEEMLLAKALAQSLLDAQASSSSSSGSLISSSSSSGSTRVLRKRTPVKPKAEVIEISSSEEGGGAGKEEQEEQDDKAKDEDFQPLSEAVFFSSDEDDFAQALSQPPPKPPKLSWSGRATGRKASPKVAARFEEDSDEEDEEAGLCEFGKGKRKTPAKARAKGKKKKATGAGSGKKAVKPSRKRGRKDIEEEVEDEDAEEYLDENGIDLMASTLHAVKWCRIILDEAHKIKGRTTNVAKAVYALRSTYKWCITGTPLQNRVSELYSLVRFLEMKPFSRYYCSKVGCGCETSSWSFGSMSRKCTNEACGHPPMSHYSYFNKYITNPIKRYGFVGDGRQAMLRLKRKVLDSIMLRRTKVERAADVNIPPLENNVQMLELDDYEKDFYESIYKQSRAKFDTYVDKGTLLHNYAHIFDLLARLRQAVDHPYLVIHGKYAGKVDLQGKPAQQIPSRSIGSSDVCGICLKDIDDLAECTVTRCKHTFHKMCVMGHIREAETNEEPVNCPVCFQEISMAIQIRGASDADVSSSEPSTGPAACVVCLDKPRDAVCLPCGHMHTCSSCAAKLPTRTCPLCRQRITKVVKAAKSALKAIPRKGAADQLLSGDEEASSTKLSLKLGWNNILQSVNLNEFSSSTKVEALVTEIQKLMQTKRTEKEKDKAKASKKAGRGKKSKKAKTGKQEDNRDEENSLPEKAIVFSQYTNMLDICEWRLHKVGIKTVKLLGSMPLAQRTSMLKAFRENPDVRVILISLKAGGEGLNLQVASRVYILDPWWNPAVEDQAIQRCHRIGQTRTVRAIRFVTKGTIEERMLQLQEKKQLVFAGAIDGSAAAISQLTEEDLRFLFS